MSKQSILFLNNILKNNILTKGEAIKLHKELNNKAKLAQAYYYNNDPNGIKMTDHEYDLIYDKIIELEEKYNINDSNSVTQTAGISEKIEKGQEEKHEFPCLSQQKIKHDINKLKDWIGNQTALISNKEDGLTIVITYDSKKLTKVVTRGNGIIGRNCTEMAKTQKCIPLTIPESGHVVVRGEFLISFNEFNKINNKLKDEEKFANPRNLASGLMNQLDLNIGKQRQGEFHVFELVKSSNYDKLKTYKEQLEWCKSQGFEIVKYKEVNKNNIGQTVNYFENNIKSEDHPIDGIVCRYNDIAYGDKLGYTSHAPRFSVAYKFLDESVPTKLKSIEFQASRTGKINPVAIFEPIELEGSRVQRCSLNNLSYIQKTLGKPYIGQEIYIRKNNMIIPGIDEKFTKPNISITTNLINIPKICPSCGQPTKIKKDGIAEILYCENPNCIAKQSKGLEKFASKACMNIEGLSTKTIEDFIDAGYLHTFSDFYKLDQYKDEIIHKPGYGKVSYDNIIKSVEKSKQVELSKFIAALGISNVSINTAKDICKHFNNDFNAIRNADEDDFMNINGIGMAAAQPLVQYFQNNKKEIDELLKYITFTTKNKTNTFNQISNSNKLLGKSFCATGSLITGQFKNRDELIETIEANGGIWESSVKKGLTYLINNDATSNSNKNVKAKQLGIKIITEQDFIDMIT